MITLEEAKKRMKKNSLKYTKKRKVLLDILMKEKKYLSAREVQERIEKVYPSISQDTIYRNLHLFVELGIVESTEINGEKRFQSSCAAGGHHHHFICTTCGKTIPLKMCPMDFFKDQLPGCTITEHRFDVFGECAVCLKTITATNQS